jgi:leucyl/phenylalanyl-tRNA--protein transferase
MSQATPPPIPAEILLLAYRSGIFPMADNRTDEEVYWVEPRERAVIPLGGLHLSRSLAKTIARDRFRVTVDGDFAGVIAACAAPRPDHPETWISGRIDASYRALQALGHAHSVECWQDGVLVGGLYGVAFDRVFCGESMFSRATDASKVALAWLVALLRHAGYALLDCQFMTGHLQSLGATEISREQYLTLLAAASRGAPRLTLPQAYSSLVGESRAAAGAGAAVAAGEGVGAADAAAEGAADGPGRGAVPPADGAPGGRPSSPGKLILQSLTQTS